MELLEYTDFDLNNPFALRHPKRDQTRSEYAYIIFPYISFWEWK